MNGSNILLDTNIILYLLSGDESLIPLLEEKNSLNRNPGGVICD
jgi:predicted nucleic acid-binding protein